MSVPNSNTGAVAPPLPPWVFELGLSELRPQSGTGSDIEVSIGTAARATLQKAIIRGARSLPGNAFRDATRRAYETLLESVSRFPAKHPVRFWAFLPGIFDPVGEFATRYAAFNSGRHQAFLSHFGTAESFASQVPTSTGVGHFGDELVLALLARDRPGVHLGNVRQKDSWHYSSRFGDRPPCFARGTLVEESGGGPHPLLIGGTASVIGEETRHAGNAVAQAAESVRNLGAVIEAARARLAIGALPPTSIIAERAGDDVDFIPPEITHLRVYVAPQADFQVVQDWCGEHAGSTVSTEWIAAEMCRPDLLVEMEALAELRDD